MEKKDLLQYIPQQIEMARKLGIPFLSIELSKRKNKKYKIVLDDGSQIHYGSFGMSDYLMHKDEKRKENFHKRFSKSVGYSNPKSGLYYSRWLTWT